MNADLIVVGPGGLHTSLIPNFLVEGVSEALTQKRMPKKIFVVNLMNRKGQTTHFKVSDYLKEIETIYRRRYLRLHLGQQPKPSARADRALCRRRGFG